MSKVALREVEFYSDGELIKTVTDKETARAIGMYKDVYNKIQSFDIMSYKKISVEHPKLSIPIDCETLVARSHRVQIECIKEYVPGLPITHNGAQYACKIVNTKSGKRENIEGGVAALYYKLFRGRIK